MPSTLQYEPQTSILRKLENSVSESEKQPLIIVASGWKGLIPSLKKNINLKYCPQQLKCEFSSKVSESNYKRAKMIVFHFNKAPPNKPPSSHVWGHAVANVTKDWTRRLQPWVFLQWESPGFHHENHRHKDNLYNYTMTYRHDSDVPYPYSNLWELKRNFKDHLIDKMISENATKSDIDDTISKSPHETFKIPVSRNIASEKKFGVLAVVSNCKSGQRNNIMKTLKNLVKWPDGSSAVELYGKCGSRFDNDHNNTGRIGNHVFDRASQFRFYLAIENSGCYDYITEKFWNHCIRREVVPIAGGPPRRIYEKVIDKNAFLHVKDEQSLEKLAQKINHYLANDTAYNSLFAWRNKDPPYSYKFATEEEFGQTGWCRLCEIATYPEKNRNIVKSIQDWWYHDDMGNPACQMKE